MKEKLKSFLADTALYTAVIVVLVGVGSFFLGRLSVTDTADIKSSYVNTLAVCPTPVLTVSGELGRVPVPEVLVADTQTETTASNTNYVYVASKSGTRYHHLTCPGAKQIKEENKLFFSTAQQAEAAGYSKAANCNQ
jgi:hypothetical protein